MLELLEEYKSQSYKIRVKCVRCKRIWEVRPSDLLRGHGCGCTSKSINLREGVNDLATLYKELCLDWDYEKNMFPPTKFTKSSHTIIHWKCHICGNEWDCSILTRTKGRGQCPICHPVKYVFTPEIAARRQEMLVRKRGSLSENNPTLAALWHPTKNTPLTPNDVTVSSQKRVWWMCHNGHEWQSIISNMNKRPYCSVCHNKDSTPIVLPGINDLATKNPKLLEEWDYTRNIDIDPRKISAGSHRKAWWICKGCGHNWASVVSDRNRGHGCPLCSRVNNRRYKKVKNLDTGSVYHSAAEAAKTVDISKHLIAACCRGERETVGGYHWKYVD